MQSQCSWPGVTCWNHYLWLGLNGRDHYIALYSQQLSYSTELKACLPLWSSREQGNETLEDGRDTFYWWETGGISRRDNLRAVRLNPGFFKALITINNMEYTVGENTLIYYNLNKIINFLLLCILKCWSNRTGLQDVYLALSTEDTGRTSIWTTYGLLKQARGWIRL